MPLRKGSPGERFSNPANSSTFWPPRSVACPVTPSEAADYESGSHETRSLRLIYRSKINSQLSLSRLPRRSLGEGGSLATRHFFLQKRLFPFDFSTFSFLIYPLLVLSVRSRHLSLACRAEAERRRVTRHLVRRSEQRAFTLIELLVVVAIIAFLLVLIAPAITSRKSANDLTSAAYEIKGALETGRTYAKANNTYTWVG